MAKKKKTQTHRVTGKELEANPELAASGVREDDLIRIDIADEDVPEFVLRADSTFGLRVMISALQHAGLLTDPEERAAYLTTLRNFDLYEERIRTAVEAEPEMMAAAAQADSE